MGHSTALDELREEWLSDMLADHDILTVKSYRYYLANAPFRTVEDLSECNIHIAVSFASIPSLSAASSPGTTSLPPSRAAARPFCTEVDQ